MKFKVSQLVFNRNHGTMTVAEVLDNHRVICRADDGVHHNMCISNVRPVVSIADLKVGTRVYFAGKVHEVQSVGARYSVKLARVEADGFVHLTPVFVHVDNIQRIV